MVQPGKRPTLDSGSGRDLTGCKIEPRVGLSAPLSAPLQINKKSLEFSAPPTPLLLRGRGTGNGVTN